MEPAQVNSLAQKFIFVAVALIAVAGFLTTNLELDQKTKNIINIVLGSPAVLLIVLTGTLIVRAIMLGPP